MKTKNLLACVLILLSINSFSQDKGYIGLSIGGSSPNGDFALTDIDNEKSGFAKTGTIYDLSFGYKLKKMWGVGGLIRLQNNPYDIDMVKAGLFVENPSLNYTVTSNSWTTIDIMAGFYASQSLNDRFDFDFRMYGGYVLASSPETKIVVTDNVNTIWMKSGSSSSFTFGYMIGAGLKYKATEKICILANIDYLGSELEFEDVLTTSNFAEPSKSNYTQSLGAINFAFGIGYRF